VKYWNSDRKLTKAVYFYRNGVKTLEFYANGNIKYERFEKGFLGGELISTSEFYPNGKMKKLLNNCWRESEPHEDPDIVAILYTKCNELYWDQTGKQIEKGEVETLNK